MADYAFVSTWRIDAPIEAVWEAIYHSERWPTWWKYVEGVVEIQAGDDRGVGSLRRFTWRTRLPYTLSFTMRTTRVDPPTVLEGVATGELNGTGRWRLTGDGRATTVRYEWRVRTTKRWMNALAPLARPLFAWNHRAVMREGGESLARLLGARLVSADHDLAATLPADAEAARP